MGELNFDDLIWIYDLFSIGQVAVEESEDEVYQALLKHILYGFNGKTGCLALIDKDKNDLYIKTGIGLPQEAIGSRIELGSGILGWVAENNISLLLNGDVSNDERFQNIQKMPGSKPNSAMCWPLSVKGEVIGVISVNQDANESEFTDSELEHGKMVIPVISLVANNLQLNRDRELQIKTLTDLNNQLNQTQQQLVQQEKLASIGQLAAGVAHEINNPIGFVLSNVTSLSEYAETFIQLIKEYEILVENLSCGNREKAREAMETIRDIKKTEDVAFMLDDIEELVKDSLDGMERVRSIVAGLKSFARVDDQSELKEADINECIKSTLKVVWNELKYKCEVKTNYGDLPIVECFPGSLNQVFMNLLVNASHAIEKKGVIEVETGCIDEDYIFIRITDDGSGIDPENISKLFNPFFTTKEVGKGTGLGLSISYGIIQKHNGELLVDSELGVGTTFTISIPVVHVENEDDNS
ncbi:MAG: GAF domain-containing protein [Gammaproteobacteria bacterium]|nr:MAG: GAF domain-containing protein [Gammaproteobacteria bacterium]